MKVNAITSMPRMRGISLTEGLVALVVLTVGLLALFNFQAGLLSSGADAKARTEALQIADSKLGYLRTQAGLAYGSQAAFVADASNIFSGTEAVTGTNAAFTVSWSDTDVTNPVRKTVAVTVQWTDKKGTQQVQLNSDVRWRDPELGVALLAKTLPNGGTITTPTGTAEYGDDVADYSPGSIPGTANVNDDGTTDGTRIATPDTPSGSGRYELIDSTGTILLYSDTAFATISGRIYLTASDFSNSLVNEVFAGAPDISVCTTTRTKDNGDLYDPIQNASGTDAYYYVNYKCYMGAGWFGNIGVVMDDGSGGNSLNTNDKSCVGDPEASDTGYPDSRHPQLAFTRIYRGYSELVDSSGNPQVDGSGNRLYLSSGMAADQQLAGDSFLLTTITGTQTDSDCLAPLNVDIDSAVAGTQTEFVNNVGKFVCLDVHCPATLPTDVGVPVASVATHTISGAISPDNTVSGIVTSDGDICTVNANSYQCSVYDLGAGWNGYIEATAASGYIVTSTNPMYFTGLSGDSSGNDFVTGASGTPRTLTITGSITNVNGQVTVSSFALDGGGSCSYTMGSSTYSCTTASFTTSWSGTMTVTQNKTLCNDGVTEPAAGIVNRTASTVGFTGVTATSLVKNITVAKNNGSCP